MEGNAVQEGLMRVDESRGSELGESGQDPVTRLASGLRPQASTSSCRNILPLHKFDHT